MFGEILQLKMEKRSHGVYEFKIFRLLDVYLSPAIKINPR